MKPSEHQSPWPKEKFLQEAGEKDEDSLELDVLIVGAGPAGLTTAIKLADLSKEKNLDIQIGVMEKGESLGAHCLSGAVINPLVFSWLFPDKKEKDLPFRQRVKKESFCYLTKTKKIPLLTPPVMKSKSYYTASLSEVVRFLGEEAEKRGVHIFPNTPAEKLLLNKKRVCGVLSKSYGENKGGEKEPNYEPSYPIFSKVVVLSEGSRGHLTQTFLESQGIKSHYPQVYALGVKELWEVKNPPQGITHTLGYPLKNHTFGGSFFYPMGENLLSIGLVVGLDSKNGSLSVHDKLQEMKEHPFFKKHLKGGKRLEWGAKSLPEGGYHAIPSQLSGNGVLITGDSAGFLNMGALKGIHYAMASGFYAAETLFEAFLKKDFSDESLKLYDKKIKESFIAKELYIYRNLRQGFHKGLLGGLFNAGLITLTRGLLPRDFSPKDLKKDAEALRSMKEENFSDSLKSKVDSVYLSGNKTRDKIPSHLIEGGEVSKELAQFYERLCPAGVYELRDGKLLVNAPNCVDCKATDVLGPRWTPRERGSGPNYKQM